MKVIHFLNLLLFFLCFYENAFARPSDQEMVAIIREMAEPSPTKRIFYIWVSKKDRDNILFDGKVTPEIYGYFMQFKAHFSLAGPGLYVYKSPENGLLEGEVLIQMETEPGYRYLDLSDEKILKSLREKGVILEDVYRLNSNVALNIPDKWPLDLGVEYDPEKVDEVLYDIYQPKIVFKSHEGVKVTSFSGKGLSLDTLTDVLLHNDLSKEQEKYFLDSVKANIKKRVKRYIALLDPENKISKEKRAREFYKLKMGTYEGYEYGTSESDYIDLGIYLSYFEKVLSKKDLRKIAHLMLGGINYENVIFELDWYSEVLKHLSKSDTSEMVRNVEPHIKAFDYGLSFLKATGDALSKKNVSKIVEVMLPLLTDSTEGSELLKDISYREYYREHIQQRAPTLRELAEEIDKEEDTNRRHFLLLQLGMEHDRPGSLKRYQEENDGFDKDYTLSTKDRQKIIDRMLEFAQSEHELHSWPLFPSELERAIQKFRSSGCNNSLKKE